MDVKVSVIIPSFKGSHKLVELVNKLVEDDYRNKEVLVVVDAPSPEVAEKLRYQPVKTIFRQSRQGRVSALIEAFKQSSGDLLIFLDDDVCITGEGFLSRVVESMKCFEIGEFMKTVEGQGLLAQTVNYEFMSFNYGSMLLANRTGKCLGLNGAAFAIWRPAYEKIGGFRPKIPDDFDLGIRSYVAGLRFGFLKSPSVVNYAPSGWRDWFKQRVRWGIGAAVWVKENWRTLLKIIREEPSLILLLLFLILPSLASFTITFFLNTLLEDRLIWVGLLTLSSLYSGLLPFATIFSYGLFVKILLLFTKTLIALIAAFAFFSAFYYRIAREMGFRFNLAKFAFLYFVYSPLWFTILLSGFIRVFVFNKNSLKDRP
ncbi:MAG: glycosyltransferase family 2 protein [Thermoproteota archaeon]